MAHHRRRATSYIAPYTASPSEMNEAQYMASRVRSREEKEHAAQQAQLRAAANRQEVLRDTTWLAEENGRNLRSNTLRRASGNEHNTTSSTSHDREPRAVRFSPPGTENDGAKKRSSQRKHRDNSRSRNHRPADKTSPSHHSLSWTSKLKAWTESRKKDATEDTHTETSTSFNGHHHNHHSHRNRHAQDRGQPQTTTATHAPFAEAHGTCPQPAPNLNPQAYHHPPPQHAP